MYTKYNILDIIIIIILILIIYVIISIINKKINKNILKKEKKKEKFDNKVDCISFPFLCSTGNDKIINQYSNFRLLHSAFNIKKAI